MLLTKQINFFQCGIFTLGALIIASSCWDAKLQMQRVVQKVLFRQSDYLTCSFKMFVFSRDTFDKTLVFAVYDYDRYTTHIKLNSDFS